jgi:hypothetical protein
LKIESSDDDFFETRKLRRRRTDVDAEAMIKLKAFNHKQVAIEREICELEMKLISLPDRNRTTRQA